VSQLSENYEEILSGAHGNFEELRSVLEQPTIIINYVLLLLRIIITAKYRYYIIFIIKSSTRNVIRKKMWQ
jgi:hypothetical protein